MIQFSKTLQTLNQIEGSTLLSMDYNDDYKFDEFLKVGAASDQDVKNFVENHLFGGKRMDCSLPNMACSTFLAPVQDVGFVFGRNLDQIECRQLLLKTAPQNGYESISVVSLSYLGLPPNGPLFTEDNKHFILSAPYVSLDGVNSCGLAIGILKIPQASTCQRRGKICLTSTTAIRLVLDKCATVDEAVSMLSEYDMNASANTDFHFHIVDRTGHSVVVEYVENEMKVIESGFATNFLLTPGVEVGHGHDRYEKMVNTVSENPDGFADMNEPMKLLSDVSANSTRWSSVYDLKNCSLLLSVNRDYENLYTFKL